ncbi:MAG: glucose-1-phosphate cytidylyltransferase [Candidatus Anstonellaceae archaeon]
MKVVILAGGFGTRLSEETLVKPKPMVEIGGMPILWHIMKIYSYYGFRDFIICLGYKGYMIKEWFANYFLHNSDVTIDLKTNKIDVHESKSEDWKVTLIDTGLNTSTGGRIKKIQKFIDGTFMLTYGDGVADININSLLNFHKKHNKAATITAARPPGRFGVLDLDGNVVRHFAEKPPSDASNVWVNAGFFVLEPKIFDYIKQDVPWEGEPLENLAKDRELMAYKHMGFWHPMDKLKDKLDLEKLWETNPPWKVWSD